MLMSQQLLEDTTQRKIDGGVEERNMNEMTRIYLHQKKNTCYSALIPSCAQINQYNGDVQAEKHKSQSTPHAALKIET